MTVDQATMLLIGAKLLSGKVHSAEKLAAQMTDPKPAMDRIAQWKADWAGAPHGEWEGDLP